jgi:hypothetical protein
MSRLAGDEIMPTSREFDVRARDGGRDRDPPSVANLFGRLGVLLLITLCFGFAAQFLFGAP